MKFWTVQPKEVIDQIVDHGIYFADFSKSEYVQGSTEIEKYYHFLLDNFSRVNNKASLEGLIFAFTGYEDGKTYPIHTSDDFYALIQRNKPAIKSLWEYFEKRDSYILELVYPDIFNPLYAEINDIQLIMPPTYVLPPYEEEDLIRIMQHLMVGTLPLAKMPSEIAQAHLPYIRAENIVTVYDFFPFIENK